MNKTSYHKYIDQWVPSTNTKEQKLCDGFLSPVASMGWRVNNRSYAVFFSPTPVVKTQKG